MPSIAPTALPTTPPVTQNRKRFDSSSSAQTTAPQKAEPKASRNSTKLIISAGSVAFLKDGFSLSFAAFFEKTGFFSDKTQKRERFRSLFYCLILFLDLFNAAHFGFVKMPLKIGAA